MNLKESFSTHYINVLKKIIYLARISLGLEHDSYVNFITDCKLYMLFFLITILLKKLQFVCYRYFERLKDFERVWHEMLMFRLKAKVVSGKLLNNSELLNNS